MKWADIQPQQGNFTFSQADAIVNTAKVNKQLLRCHALVWYQDLPTWITDGQWMNETLINVLQTHITTVVEHYKDSCYSWDVVNEGLMDDGTLRDSVFLSVIG
jgi:endo-1,4-beta-xylanase